eukprot:scaffold1083_cov376-Prasinococcus_capsulatus_cf.AAC.2
MECNSPLKLMSSSELGALCSPFKIASSASWNFSSTMRASASLSCARAFCSGPVASTLALSASFCASFASEWGSIALRARCSESSAGLELLRPFAEKPWKLRRLVVGRSFEAYFLRKTLNCPLLRDLQESVGSQQAVERLQCALRYFEGLRGYTLTDILAKATVVILLRIRHSWARELNAMAVPLAVPGQVAGAERAAYCGARFAWRRR